MNAMHGWCKKSSSDSTILFGMTCYLVTAVHRLFSERNQYFKVSGYLWNRIPAILYNVSLYLFAQLTLSRLAFTVASRD